MKTRRFNWKALACFLAICIGLAASLAGTAVARKLTTEELKGVVGGADCGCGCDLSQSECANDPPPQCICTCGGANCKCCGGLGVCEGPESKVQCKCTDYVPECPCPTGICPLICPETDCEHADCAMVDCRCVTMLYCQCDQSCPDGDHRGTEACTCGRELCFKRVCPQEAYCGTACANLDICYRCYHDGDPIWNQWYSQNGMCCCNISPPSSPGHQGCGWYEVNGVNTTDYTARYSCTEASHCMGEGSAKCVCGVRTFRPSPTPSPAPSCFCCSDRPKASCVHAVRNGTAGRGLLDGGGRLTYCQQNLDNYSFTLEVDYHHTLTWGDWDDIVQEAADIWSRYGVDITISQGQSIPNCDDAWDHCHCESCPEANCEASCASGAIDTSTRYTSEEKGLLKATWGGGAHMILAADDTGGVLGGVAVANHNFAGGSVTSLVASECGVYIFTGNLGGLSDAQKACIVAHEIGHLLGLVHNFAGGLMYYETPLVGWLHDCGDILDILTRQSGFSLGWEVPGRNDESWFPGHDMW